MIPHAGAQVSSQAVASEVDIADINAWGVSASFSVCPFVINIL